MEYNKKETLRRAPFPAPLIALLLALSILPRGSAAQTWDEFFSQGEKQDEYDKTQLVSLGTGWARAMNTAFKCGEGLTTIMNIVDGDFNLTRDFFGHLNGVNPDVAAGAKVADIIMFQYYITRDMGKVWNFCSGNRNFTAAEIWYIEKVHANFLVLTDMNITELVKIISPGEKTMTDAERIEAIDRIYEEQVEQRAFVQCLGDDVYQLSRERQKERNSVEGYGIIVNRK